MKRFVWFLFFFLLIIAGLYYCYKQNYLPAVVTDVFPLRDNPSVAYTTFDNCPPEGDAVSEKAIDLNKFKNRYTFPQSGDFATDISLDKILEPGNDKDRWSSSKAARIKGYIYEVKSGGIETCNCKEREDADKDTHIELVADPMQTGKTFRMIVEVTPRSIRSMHRPF